MSSEVDWRVNATVAPLATQLETLIQSLREFSERSSNRSGEENVASERSRFLSQRSDFVTGDNGQQLSDWQNTRNPFDERPTQQRYNTRSSVGHTTTDNYTACTKTMHPMVIQTTRWIKYWLQSLPYDDTGHDETAANPSASIQMPTGEN